MRQARARLAGFVWAALSVGAAAAGCNNDSTGTDPCPGGICTGSQDGGADASSSTCTESWVCSTWTTSGSGNQGTRVCTDTKSCGTTQLKPAETATLPALDLEYFKCNVQPILDHKCSQLGCHGTETDRALRNYARGRLRNAEMIAAGACGANNPPTTIQLDQQCTGSLEGPCRSCPHTATEWRRNYDSARGFALDASLKPIPAGMEDTSELIAQPIVGGKAHANVHLFKSGDADHTTLKQWLGGAKLGMTCTTTD